VLLDATESEAAFSAEKWSCDFMTA
jgi:hypothetical protein